MRPIENTTFRCIDVGGGPSGPSIEGPFCRTVHLCRTLGERKVEKKRKKWRKKEGKIEKREKEMRKKGKLQRFCLFSMHFCLFRVILCSSDSSFCRTARLCRTLEGRWRPDTSHCPTSMCTYHQAFPDCIKVPCGKRKVPPTKIFTSVTFSFFP